MTESKVNTFLAGKTFAVVGASRDRQKYGNKVLRAYLQKGHSVYPINPNAATVECLEAFPDLASLPRKVDGVSFVCQPEVTRTSVDQAIDLGIQNIWMQPGAENADAIRRAEEAGVNVIACGPCILVVMGYHESVQ